MIAVNKNIMELLIFALAIRLVWAGKEYRNMGLLIKIDLYLN